MIRKTSLTSLEITGIATGGDGVARADGLVVFTPRTAPGDHVVAEVSVEGRVGRGRLKIVESAGAARVEPACPHYEEPDRCGGCQLQHVTLDAQREAKRVMVRDAFQRIARREVPLPEIHGGAPWRYRRALTLAIRREESSGEGRVRAGLRAYDDPEAVFDLRTCLITDERIVDTWHAIVAAAEHLPAGDRLRGTVRWLDEHPLFVLEGGDEWPALQQFLAAVPTLAAIWWQAEGRRRRLVADRRPSGTPGASFAQVNEEVAAMVHADVIARAMAHAPSSLVDGYSGAGATAIAFAERGVRVVAVELDEEATEYTAARLPEGSRAIAARVEDVLPRLLPADVVVLNPPRAGLDERVTAALRTAEGKPAPRAIIYVSCDPATLARDVSRLVGWRVHALTCYDMFPQTAHVETVCELRPEAA